VKSVVKNVITTLSKQFSAFIMCCGFLSFELKLSTLSATAQQVLEKAEQFSEPGGWDVSHSPSIK